MAKVFGEHGLRLDVHISHGSVGQFKDYPYIEVASWIESLDRAGKLHKLIGLGNGQMSFPQMGDDLQDYWKHFRALYPGHQFFNLVDAGQIPVQQAVPILLHGDEGTTYKKDGCLCFSMQSPMGRGTLSAKIGPMVVDEDNETSDPLVNYVGHALETRFLLAMMLKDPWQRNVRLFSNSGRLP